MKGGLVSKKISVWDKFLLWLVFRKKILDKVAFIELLVKRGLTGCHVHMNPKRKTK
jgi:hypothetical protein